MRRAPLRHAARSRSIQEIVVLGKRRQLESHSLIRDKVNASTSDLALGTVSSLVASQVFTD